MEKIVQIQGKQLKTNAKKLGLEIRILKKFLMSNV
jgi:hypothetical protein